MGIKVSQCRRHNSTTAAEVAAQFVSSSSRPTPLADAPAKSITLLPLFAGPSVLTPKDPRPVIFNSGAAKAAENAGESAKARDYYQKIVVIADGADRTRTEVADARAFLTKR